MSSGGALAAAAPHIGQAIGRRLDPERAESVGGGCIHAAWRVPAENGPVFLKTNAPGAAWLFEAEADGLAGLAEAGCIRVPAVLGTGSDAGMSWLALEWMDCRSGNHASHRRLGERLAALHCLPREAFGWRRDNAIGSTPQPNTPSSDWAEFFAERRLGYQLDVAARGGAPARLLDSGRRLQEAVPAILGDRQVAPALLHGDLWGGNWAADEAGEPFLFDPAVYCGDPEADIAMTRLFGGFSREFYGAYEATWPRAAGYETRIALYQLYHLLNHANLFGGGYVAQSESAIGALLARV
ncbi:MAG: fructosamine kinase family protein [Gammaproteobacteria bacterium]